MSTVDAFEPGPSGVISRT